MTPLVQPVEPDEAPTIADPLAGRLQDRAGWRLTEHFFRALFDFGILTQAGSDSFKHGLIFAIGLFVGIAFLLTRLFVRRYFEIAGSGSAELYRRMLLGDELLLMAFPMLLAAFVTLLISDALFPDEPDFRILGPLPVRKSTVFAAKLTALLLFNVLFIGLAHLTLLPVVLVMSLNRWREHGMAARAAAWALASGSASAFAILAVIATMGVLTLVLSRSRLHTLTALLKSTLVGILVSCIPYVLDLPTFGPSLSTGSASMRLVPPAWFLGLERAILGSQEPWPRAFATLAIGAVAATASVTAVTYALLFKRFEQLMLRSGRRRRTSGRARLPVFLRGASPQFHAVRAFTITTLTRSHLHQSVLVALSALGVGLVVNRLVGLELADAAARPALASLAMSAPFTLMFAWGLGMRASLALPMEQRANWIFRMTESDASRQEQLRAVHRVVTTYVVYVPVALTFPLLWITIGVKALVAAAIMVLVGLVFVELALLDWRRIPFTCTYEPSRLFVAQTLGLLVAWSIFTALGRRLVLAATSAAVVAVVLVVVLSAVAYWCRRRRVKMWKDTPLMFEEDLEGRPLQLRL